MQCVIDGLDSVRMYLDYAIVFDRTPSDHAQSIGAFLDRLKRQNLEVAPGKANIGEKKKNEVGSALKVESTLKVRSMAA